MRLLFAARLSKRGDARTGIDTQDQDVRAWAEANGHTIVAVTVDEQSGRIHPRHRKDLGVWLTEPSRIAQYDGIVAATMDRLSRSWCDVPQMREWAEAAGKTLFVVQPNLKWPCPEDPYMNRTWDDAAAMASEEWDLISQRYRRMQAHLKDNGYLVGCAAFGFRIVRAADSSHKTLAVDPREARRPCLALASLYCARSFPES